MISRGVPLWHSGHLIKTHPELIAFLRSTSSNLPHTRHTANLDQSRVYFWGNPGGAASPSADAYLRNVSIPDTTILALITRISMPTSETERFASITRPLSKTRSTRS